MIKPPYTERYVRWCERTTVQLMGSFLLDYPKSVQKVKGSKKIDIDI